VPTTINHKVNTQNNIHGKSPTQTSGRKFPSSGGVPEGRGGSFYKNLPTPPQSFPHLLKLEKSLKKNHPLRFPVKSFNKKKLLLKIEIKQYIFYQDFRY
jgi:hypothetical protein